VRYQFIASVIVVLALAGAAWASTQTSSEAKSTSLPTCGVERWAVKTLQDPAGRNLNLMKVTKTTVNALRSLSVQRGLGDSRGKGTASTVYDVQARLVSAKARGPLGHPSRDQRPVDVRDDDRRAPARSPARAVQRQAPGPA
jgi:hypothetical protein